MHPHYSTTLAWFTPFDPRCQSSPIAPKHPHTTPPLARWIVETGNTQSQCAHNVKRAVCFPLGKSAKTAQHAHHSVDLADQMRDLAGAGRVEVRQDLADCACVGRVDQHRQEVLATLAFAAVGKLMGDRKKAAKNVSGHGNGFVNQVHLD
jgi:hypothetical protein